MAWSIAACARSGAPGRGAGLRPPARKLLAPLAGEPLRQAAHPSAEGRRPWHEAVSSPESRPRIGPRRRLPAQHLPAAFLADLERALARTTLAHYADFHRPDLCRLRRRADPGSTPRSRCRCALALAHSLVSATLADLIPGVQDYAAALASWGGKRAGRRRQQITMPCDSGAPWRSSLPMGQAEPLDLYGALLRRQCWSVCFTWGIVALPVAAPTAAVADDAS